MHGTVQGTKSFTMSAHLLQGVPGKTDKEAGI